MKAPGNEVERERNDEARKRAAERAASQYKELASVGREEGFAEPRTNSTRRDACKDTRLEEKGANACRRTSAEQTDHERRGNDAQADEDGRHGTGDESDGKTNADQDQGNDHNEESEDLHTARILRSPALKPSDNEYSNLGQQCDHEAEYGNPK
jgi:hypothetical protein